MDNRSTKHITIQELSVPFVGYQTYNTSITDYTMRVTSCGIACVSMILGFYNKMISPEQILLDGHATGGYTEHGWLHGHLIDVLAQHGVTYERHEYASITKGCSAIVASISAGSPVMVSTLKTYMDEVSFHLILIVGILFSEDEQVIGFCYLDPADYHSSPRIKHMSRAQFVGSWRRIAFIKSA